MAAQIELTNVAFTGGVAPSAPITDVIIKYRKTADPDVSGSYTTFMTNAVILVNGNFQSAPLIIPGLEYSTSYTVWVKPPCGPGVKKIFVTTAPACVDITGFTGSVSES